jgi:phenylalanine-4-hydroxylase
MTGETDASHHLRGNYQSIRDDYTLDQDWDAYSPAEHDRWRRLYERQSSMMDRYAVALVSEKTRELRYERGIPRFTEVNAALAPATGWKLVAVPGLLPDDIFFTHLANRSFPVTVWLRREDEFDYIVEPDIFHDFFGHVPLLFDGVFADYLQKFGKGALKAKSLKSLEYLARLYWYTVEFGLIQTSAGLRTYGAGILSSGGELPYSVESPSPYRVHLDILRCMQTRYKIDSYQETYFVIDSFQELFDKTDPDFSPYYDSLHGRDDLAADARLPGERSYQPNKQPF